MLRLLQPWRVSISFACIDLEHAPTLLQKRCVRVLVASIFLLAPLPVVAHEFWGNGQRVDPITKHLCCGDADHFELVSEQIAYLPNGYRVRGHFVTREGLIGIDETIPSDHAQPSPDGKFHINLIDGRIRCFFAPLSY